MQVINQPQLITYDGTLEGFFTVIFEIYANRYKVDNIIRDHQFQSNLFTQPLPIATEMPKAERVLKKVTEKVNKDTFRDILITFLAENEAPEMQLYYFIRKVLDNQVADQDFRDEHRLVIHQVAQKVKMEAHRFKGLIRFKLTRDEVYTATIEPDHDILPLLSRHFQQRYADQQWIIFDLKRQKGLFHLNGKVEIMKGIQKINTLNPSDLHENEIVFQQMWQEYFRHVNIAERKNLRLQKQHMPSRYWKYLIEKDVRK